ncbi:hypothetical protein BH10CYA1_BH10CYA1_45960 [soil metagenome]
MEAIVKESRDVSGDGSGANRDAPSSLRAEVDFLMCGGERASATAKQAEHSVEAALPMSLDFKPAQVSLELKPGQSERLRDDGCRVVSDRVVGKDGIEVERMLRVEKRNGSVSEYSYDRDDPTKLISYKDTIKTCYGKTLVCNSVREDDSGTFKYTDSEGRLEKHLGTHFEEGHVKYRAGDLGSRIMDKLMGPSWLTVDALTEAKEHFVEVAGKRLFNKSPEALDRFVDKLIHHFQEPGKTGVKPMSDDKLAQFLTYAAKPLETERNHRKNGAHVLSDREIEKATEQMLKTVSNPELNNNQGQIGSCYMNSIRYLAEKTQLNRIGQAFASMYTNGSLKGHRFDADDLRPLYNQDYYNHAMNSAFVKMAGVFNKLQGNYRGTTTPEAETAYKKLFGKEFPVFSLGQQIRQRDLDDAIAKFGGAACITLGGAHAQVVHKNARGQYVLENWWKGYGGYEGVLTKSQLHLI